MKRITITAMVDKRKDLEATKSDNNLFLNDNLHFPTEISFTSDFIFCKPVLATSIASCAQ